MDSVADIVENVSIHPTEKQNEYWFVLAVGKGLIHTYKFFPKSPANSGDKLELFWKRDHVLNCSISNNGICVCILSEDSNILELIDIETEANKGSITIPDGVSLKEMLFSPLDTHLVVLTSWHEYNQNNLVFYKLSAEEAIPVWSTSYQKTYTIKRFPIWTFNEEYCIIRVKSDIIVWKDNEFNGSTPFGTININPHSDSTIIPTSVILSISPVNRKNTAFIGLFMSNQGKFDRGVLKVYSTDDLNKPCFDRQFNQAEEGDLFWNKNASSLIFRTFTNNVKGLSSYYGGNSLYLINVATGSCKTLSNPTNGIVHDVSWSKKYNEVIISRGPMPAEFDVYDGRTGSKTLSFGRCSKNTVRRDPFERLILFGGFGNLGGDIDIWDTKTKKKIAESKSDCSVTCEFSPDGRYFVTATTAPRMRVDCCFKIFSYSGKCVAKVEFDELYHVYIKSPKIVFKERDPSPDVFISETREANKPLYRPPGSLGNHLSTLYRDRIMAQNMIATPVAHALKTQNKGPPGADASLLSAASKIGKKKKSKK